MLDAEQLGQRGLEPLGERPLGGGQRAAVEHLGEGLELLGAERAAAGVLVDGSRMAPLDLLF